jgi:hypothetical protein
VKRFLVSSAGGPKRRACGRPVPNALENYYLPGQSNRASASSSSTTTIDGSVGFLWVCRNRVRVRSYGAGNEDRRENDATCKRPAISPPHPNMDSKAKTNMEDIDTELVRRSVDFMDRVKITMVVEGRRPRLSAFQLCPSVDRWWDRPRRLLWCRRYCVGQTCPETGGSWGNRAHTALPWR